MKDSEKKLLFGFMALLLAAAIFILFNFYREKKDALERERTTLELQVVDIENLLEEEEIWTARADWLDKHHPPVESMETINNLIIRDAEADGATGVTTSNIKPMEEVVSDYYTQAGARLTATGTLEDVFRWLHELQHPEEFRVISDLQVTPDKDDDSKIVCKFALLRWYAPQSES